jgi:hypothetical protein
MSRIGHGSSIYLMAPSGVGVSKTISSVSTGTDIITTSTAHGFITGEPVVYELAVTQIAGLTDGGTYFVSVSSSTEVKLHLTYADAIAETNAVDITGSGDGALKSRRVAIGKCVEATVGGIQKATVDMTTFDSTAGYREFESALIDAGEITLTTIAPVNFVSDSANYYSELYENLEEVGNPSRVWLHFPNGQNITCACELTNFNVNDPVDDRIETQVTLKLTGQPTFNES